MNDWTRKLGGPRVWRIIAAAAVMVALALGSVAWVAAYGLGPELGWWRIRRV